MVILILYYQGRNMMVCQFPSRFIPIICVGARERTMDWVHGLNSSHIWTRILLVSGPDRTLSPSWKNDDTLECMICCQLRTWIQQPLKCLGDLLSSVYGYLIKWLLVPWGKEWGKLLSETFVRVYLFLCWPSLSLNHCVPLLKNWLRSRN